MGFVQGLFQNQNRFKRMLLGNRVVFHHVPKCAGTSVSRALRVRYALSQASIAAPATADVINRQYGTSDFSNLEHFNRIRRFRAELLHYLMWKDTYFIGGHVPFNRAAYDHLGKGYRFITVLRDPVERFISEYFYNRGRNHQARIDADLAEYIESPLGQRNALRCCEYFSGQLDLDLEDPESLKHRAKDNLKAFDVVGFTDSMGVFEQKVRQALNVRVSFGRENQGNRSSAEINKEITPALRSRLEDLCKHDREIYDFARDLVLQRGENS
ncbi:hypothetical protein CK501_06515 [Halovibrio salipaludis]|uniref:Sulfotransferase family protein n=1 Tax=Halovibrio salipaludis TaxID=2032626 RepID=A0A2A2F8F1_9GAMM|nr:sulfotransferase family 2 domain-containing protein [Halovibrio salipaludis]PAU81208.1 hypothetical protein CK501_06515 [Halovibrio salipaludis]